MSSLKEKTIEKPIKNTIGNTKNYLKDNTKNYPKDNPIDRVRVSAFMQESSNIFAENKLLRILLIAMIVWSAFNSIMLSNALDARTTIIMPPDGSYKHEVTNKKLDDSYLYKMARYIVFLTGNLTAATGRDQFNEVLQITHPTRYGEFQEHFRMLAKEIERYPNISYIIELDGSNGISVKGNSITVTATKKRLVGNSITRKERMTYQIDFAVDNGKFWLMDMNEVTRKTAAKNDEN